ncbi:hypothetical protein [Nonomuraea turcica]|uniref:hypothetical protein n=1 Tax=Nonomuraea sp. G32 TaxID=3067274 RepID=UPI00273AD68C|nr:hypothetical protein [Nonomuraea sp. G32]MDP4502821.1 hypothetical protein [Nonomuraea sp. G32]
MKTLQSANGLPDHGHGGLGRVAHGALTSLSGIEDGPKLFLGYNTLPNPPFPLVGYLQNDLGPEAAALDPASLLRAAAGSMRAHPVPPKEAFAEGHRRVAAVMRVDAMVFVVSARAFAPQQSPSARALWANLVEGYYRDGDAEACVDARETALALGVDRQDGRVLLVAERGPSGGYAAPVRVEGKPKGELFDLLGEVLDAQYVWTKAAFAL